jgi:predicted MFS family arabinose efflux permease
MAVDTRDLRERDAWTGLVILTGVSFFNYLDRMVLPAVAQPIKEEFALTDSEVGLLTGFAFVLIYAFVGLPIARLADRGERRTILAVALAVWSIATAACGFARSFLQLLCARVSVGIGEAACQPVGYALLADYFPPARRATAMGWFMVGNSLGIMAGFGLGGWLGHQYGWRTAFLVVGLPGVLLAIVVRLVMREPPRRGIESSGSPVPPGMWEAVGNLIRNRAFVRIIVAYVAYAVMIFFPIAWLPAFFIRTHKLGLDVVGAWTGFGVGIGMAVGMIIGGVWADRLYRQRRDRPLLLCMWAALAASLAYAFAFWSSSAVLAFAATFGAAAIGAICSPTNVASVQDVCDPRGRVTAAAIHQIATSLLGIGLGPYVIGALSDAFAPWAGEQSLRYALTVGLISCFAAALAYWYAAAAVREIAATAPEQTSVRA